MPASTSIKCKEKGKAVLMLGHNVMNIPHNPEYKAAPIFFSENDRTFLSDKTEYGI
jgi:hypothetical protein